MFAMFINNEERGMKNDRLFNLVLLTSSLHIFLVIPVWYSTGYGRSLHYSLTKC